MAERDLLVNDGDSVAGVTITDLRGELSGRLVRAIEQQHGLDVTEAEG